MSLADQIANIRTLAAQGQSTEQIAAAVGVEIGDVESVLGGSGVGMPGLSLPPGVVAVSGPLLGGQRPTFQAGEWKAAALCVVKVSHIGEGAFQASNPALLVDPASGIGTHGSVSLCFPPVAIPAGGYIGALLAYSAEEIEIPYIELAVFNAALTETLAISTTEPVRTNMTIPSSAFAGGNFWQTGSDLSFVDFGTPYIQSAAGGEYGFCLQVTPPY